MKAGKLIVIDGADASGKTTQTNLLISRLKKAGYKVAIIDFPRYGQKSAIAVEEYLQGHYGKAADLGAYIPSIFFAVDRFAASLNFKKLLAQGHIVISNRYVTANMAHQGGKIGDNKAREKYFDWVIDLEYNIFKIPKPHLNIILNMPAKVSARLLKSRGRKKDIHERDLAHLRSAEKTYLSLAKKFKSPIVYSVVKGKLRSPEEIHEEIFKIVKRKI
jgi:dTMP kinase